MRTYLSLVIITLCFCVFKINAQCITFSIQVTPESCSGCCDGTAQVVNLVGGCGPYWIQWNDPIGQMGNTAIGLCSGSYSVTVQDAGCCPIVVQGCFVPQGGTTSIYENYLANTFSVFPNPVNSLLNISDLQNQLQNSTIEIKISNTLGQNVQSINVRTQTTLIDMKEFDNGVYFLHLYKNNKHISTKKIVLQK